jgi:DNA-binding NtrC family response regulator
MERALLLHREGPLRPSLLLLRDHAENANGLQTAAAPLLPPATNGDIPSLEEIERRHIAVVLGALGGNLTRAARALGISVSTLKRKLRNAAARPQRN